MPAACKTWLQGRPLSKRGTSVASLTSDAFTVKFGDLISDEYHGALAPMLATRPVRELLTTSDAPHEMSSAAARRPSPPSPPVTKFTPDQTVRCKPGKRHAGSDSVR